MKHLSFERWSQIARFHNPLQDGRLEVQQIEVHVDPLTGHQSVFNTGLSEKATILFPDTDREYLERRAKETSEECFLCDGRWRSATPRYEEHLLHGGRLVKGEAVLFPNLFPLAAYHAVVMLGDAHCRSLDHFPVALLRDGLEVCIEFIRKVYRADPQVLYFTINANYLFPAGASVVHPHLQILGSPFPGTHHRILLEASRRYLLESGSCYWVDLMETERDLGARELGQKRSSYWLTAFSPSGSNEVQAIWPKRKHFLEWREEDILGMAEGLSTVLTCYHRMKLSTFNFSCFSGPLDSSEDAFRCMLRLINRQNVVPHYRTDDYYFQKLLKNEIMLRLPETLAAVFRSCF